MDPKTPIQNNRATRSSLACLPCRSRHLKCDGKRPCCSRCAEVGKQCQYAQSRRGGLDRAALAERRKRLAAAAHTMVIEELSPQYPIDLQLGQGLELPSQGIETDASNGHRLLDGISTGDATSGTSSPLATQILPHNLLNDALINSYFENFHTFHPFLPPQKHLMRLYQDQSKQNTLMPLIAIIRLVGYLYNARQWSASLKDYAESCFSQVPPTDPIMVQCRLLYSVALFWYDYKIEGKSQMDQATRLAIDLQMNRQEFSTTQGAGDPILQECWRRTWWSLYIVDAYYAGTQGTMNFQVVDIESTVDLPCEEKEYQSGDIPEPKTIQDWENREFAPDNLEFSSFAYLIGAVRCTAFAISTAPKIAIKEDSMHVIQTADSILNGWLLLLPKSRKQVMSKTGEINELMFQAHLLIHVATIGLHRPFSDLKFNPVEDISSCAREPPPDNPTPDLINVHAVRVLRSVEAQIRLLALPVRQFHHTPFVTCMISEGTLALLSACNFLLKGKDMMIARNQIRMTIGCLKELGEVWPRTARNMREIQTIAHHVLGLVSKAPSDSAKSSEVPPLSTGEGQGSMGSDADTSSESLDMLPSLGSIDDLCGWYNFGYLNQNIPWDMSNLS
ncbi:hypothetical protein N7510_000152 [Penicillium lagena]|uniref:uncharacterized protein n=1 Tax=Penicillium lagena TaxID=94218 RepID=UPI00253FD6E6|nr:uncharacterized protein N7510_000152 [Penicillium lagena]KAJ5623843.1 hypothetical protein N7510_000152 [Penicillium lagena]